MFEAAKKSLRKWNDKYDDRVKLQHALLVLASVGVLLSGLVALIDASLGHTLVIVSLMGYVLLIVNWIVWSLINSSVVLPITKRPARKPRK